MKNTLLKFSTFYQILFLIFFTSFGINAQLAADKAKYLGNVTAASIPSNFNTYWNQITPENAGKWGSVEATRNSMNWSQMDLAYNHAKNNGYKFKQHTLVWGSQYPSWITSLSATQQKVEIEQWMQLLAARYPNIDQIDVVNEPIKTPCPFKGALGGDGSTGWDWVIESFRLARQYFPNAKLFINEYGTENDAAARNTYKTIINLLKTRGYIDGIGVQAHQFNLDFMTAAQMQTALNDYATLGLDVHISELDITGGGSNETNQRNKYAELFPVMWEHPAVKGVTLWGYIEGSTWKANTGILNANGTERQAMTWLKSYMSGVPVANLTLSASTVSLAASASTSTAISVTSNQNWTVSSNQTWLSSSVNSGANNGSFTIAATANTTSTSRTGMVTVTGGGISRTISVSQAGTTGGGVGRSFTVRARGTAAGAQLQLRINNVLITTWNLSTTMANYTATSTTAGTVRVQYANDATNRDIQVDYLQVNTTTYQAEAQTINTALYANGRCGGGSRSEMMHCNGYIEFAGSSAGRLNAVTEAEVAEIEDIVLAPNPIVGNVVNIKVKSGNYLLKIMGSTGNIIQNSAILVQNNEYTLATALPKGLYFMQLVSAKEKYSKKIMVQ
jgi:endo-1,4-beta-xylanase